VRKALIAAAVAGAVLVVGSLVLGLGLAAFERHSGYFAPVWDGEGRFAYVVKRETSGFVWGLGWEHFTPPANSYVTSDRFALLRLDPERGRTEELQSWDGSPLVGRSLEHYRGRIFNFLRAKLEPGAAGLAVTLSMRIPRVPSSEVWSLKALWNGESAEARWREAAAGNMAAPEAALLRGRELLTLPGPESFDAAVVLIEADGRHRVLLRAPSFDAHYAGGIPPTLVEARSNRKRIERQRDFRRVHEELTDRFRRDGLNEGAAVLRAYDEMKELGYLPKGPELTATPVDEVPEGLTLFEIPKLYLEVGLFTDIAAAIATPGEPVESTTGSYLRYAEDDLGPRLEAHRAAGNDRFAIAVEGRLYLMETRRPRAPGHRDE
jgi:hypothetical protein